MILLVNQGKGQVFRSGCTYETYTGSQPHKWNTSQDISSDLFLNYDKNMKIWAYDLKRSFDTKTETITNDSRAIIRTW